MKIIYEDGGELECHKIIITNKGLYVDDLYDILIADVKEIVNE